MAKKLPKIMGFEAIALNVSDFDRSLAFYRKVLRLKVNVLAPGHFAVVTDMKLYLLHLGKRVTSRGFHIELQVVDVDAWYAYLVEKGLQPSEPEDMSWGERSLYVHDPDGHLLELSHELEP